MQITKKIGCWCGKTTAGIGGRSSDTARALQNYTLRPQLEGQGRVCYFLTKFWDYKEWEENQNYNCRLSSFRIFIPF